MKNVNEIWTKVKTHLYANPKRTFRYAILLLVASICFTTAKEIWFPSKIDNGIFPELFSQSDAYKKNYDKKRSENQAEIQKVVTELKVLKDKMLKGKLSTRDSLRTEFLLNKYKQLKHENQE